MSGIGPADLLRKHGKKVADQIGHKFTTPVLVDSQQSMKDEHPDSTDPTTPNQRNLASADVPASSHGGGVPAPLLVLGGLALVLLAAGGVGAAVEPGEPGGDCGTSPGALDFGFAPG